MLVLALRSWVTHAAYEVVVAQALRLRGCETALVTCGGGQPACEMGWGREAFPRPCDRCAWFTDRVAESARLRSYRLVDNFAWHDADDAPLAVDGDVQAERAAMISIPWFVRSSRPDTVPGGAEAQRDFEVATAADLAAFASIFDDFKPDIVFMVSGLFASERAAWQVASERGVKVVTYEMAPHGNDVVLAHESAAPEYPSDGPWERVRETPLSDAEDAELEELLIGRARNVGTHDIHFEEAGQGLRAQLGVPNDAPLASLFTNITYDSAALYKDVGFESMIDWVVGAVQAAAGTGTHLVIRVHPGESRWGTNEPVEELVRQRVGALPSNVHLVPSTSDLNSYDLLADSDVVLTYTSTVGLEAAARGIPSAVAGICHYRGKGFTVDVASEEDLRGVLSEPPVMSPSDRELARRYAYLFFVRMMIPFPAVTRDGLRTEAMVDDAAALAEDGDEWVSFVCDRILDGEDFVR